MELACVSFFFSSVPLSTPFLGSKPFTPLTRLLSAIPTYFYMQMTNFSLLYQSGFLVELWATLDSFFCEATNCSLFPSLMKVFCVYVFEPFLL